LLNLRLDEDLAKLTQPSTKNKFSTGFHPEEGCVNPTANYFSFMVFLFIFYPKKIKYA
jgi:hypothetical protein